MNFKYLTIILLALITGLTACNPQAQEETGAVKEDSIKVLPVKVITLEEVEESNELSYPSTIEAFEAVYLAPAQPGRVDRIFVEIGDHVKKGEVLAEMDKTQLRQAEIQLQQLKVDYDRMETLKKTNSISSQQYDQVKMQYDVALANIDFLRENTNITAPFSGIITGKYFEDGEMYSGAPNTQAGKAALVTLEQIKPVKTIISVSEKYFTVVKDGMEADIRLESYPDEVFKGKVFRVHPSINGVTRTFNVEVRIDNPAELLRPGMYSKVYLHLDYYKAIMAPAKAVLQQQGTAQRYVFIHKNGLVNRVNVEIGKRYDDRLEIVSDKLSVGDELVVVGQQNLMDEQRVEVVK